MTGIVAAGHPLTAEAGAAVLRDGGNAVDAAVAAMLTSWVAEPLLTGPGAGGYMLVAGAGRGAGAAGLLRRGAGAGPRAHGARGAHAGRGVVRRGRADLQLRRGVVRHVRLPRRGVARRWSGGAAMPLADLAAPAAALARAGVRAQRPAGLRVRAARRDPVLDAGGGGRVRARADGCCAEGERFRSTELGDAIELLGAEGSAPFYTGDMAAAVASWLGARGGLLTAEDLASYRAVVRAPVRVALPGALGADEPAAVGGRPLLALALALLDRRPAPPRPMDLVEVMERAQDERTDAFVERPRRDRSSRRGSCRPGWARRRTSRCWTAMGARVQRDVHERRGLGRRRARDGPAREQHHRRGGPQPAGLPRVDGGAADAVDDGADGRAAPAARSSWSWAAPAPTASARRSCRRSSAWSTGT